MKALARVGTCVLAIALSIPVASADPITFTGTGFQSSNRYRFDISGDGFVYSVSTSEGPLIVANCTPGVPCEFERSYGAGTLSAFDLVQSFASLDGLSTNSVTGRLVVIGTVSTSTAPGAFQSTVPIAFAGDIIGHFTSSGFPAAFEVVLGGPGTAVLGGEIVDGLAVVNSARYTFSGTGLTQSEIPEPGAAFLSTGGLGLLAFMFRRRRPPSGGKRLANGR